MQGLKRHASWATAYCVASCLAVLLAGCGTVRGPAAPDARESAGRPVGKSGSQGLPALPAAGSGRGGYYQDDGPGDAPPADLLAIPDPVPKVEPLLPRANRPYAVFGKTYTPVTDATPVKQRGIGSWYGKKFHGQRTSSGELYDMYKMTAAHPTLPIPSYARVTNLRNGKQVIVRINDRGPFHSSRIIDVSYTAALKLGYLGYGSSELEVERLLPEEIARMNAARGSTGMPGTQPAGSVPGPVAVAAVAPSAASTKLSASGAATSLSASGAATYLPASGASTALPASAAVTVSPSSPPATLPVAMPMPAAGESLDDFLKAHEASAPPTGSSADIGMVAVAAPVSAVGPASADMAVSAGSAAASASADPAAVANRGPAVYFLQFGAFAARANAGAARERLMRNWPQALPLPEVQKNGTTYRLTSGPFGDRNSALEAAARSGAKAFVFASLPGASTPFEESTEAPIGSALK